MMWLRYMNRFAVLGLLAALVLTGGPAGAGDSPDVDAGHLVESARLARAVWHDFPGFEADLTVTTDAQTYEGTIRVGSDFKYEIAIDEAALQPWVAAKLRSVILHRRPSQASTDERHYTFAEGDEPGHVFGRLIAQDDGGATLRRIGDRVLREVHRKSDTAWFEITTLKVLPTADGQFLPEVTSVVYRDPATGNITSNRTNHFSWTKVGEFLLPEEALTVEVAGEGARTTRKLAFSNHRLLESSSTPQERTVIHAPVPESLTSFGAAVLGDYLYVFSGHSGDAHGAGRDLLSNHFRRVRLDDPQAEWEELAMHEPAQSTALLTDGKYLYRVGGLSFLNSGEGSETNFNSTAHFARYDVDSDTWTDLPSLPEPRSSLDAAVLGRSIYVAGGWNLQGESSRDGHWHETILRFDLDHPEAGWTSLDGPGYITRALSVAAHDGKLYLIGGIQQRGITRKVSIYDPQTGTWSEGPELKSDSSLAGFATSSFGVGGQLYTTGNSGVVYRLSSDGSDWEIADRLMFPRMFLRVVPWGDDRLVAVAGTMLGGGGAVPVVESLQVNNTPADSVKTVRFSVDFGGQAKHSQSLVLDGVNLYAFGGNASREPHDFSESAFVREAFVFDIARQTVKALPNLPRAMQSGSAVVKSQTSEHSSILLMGGLGYTANGFSALDEVFEFDPEAETWERASVRLPQPRSMFRSEVHDDAVWMFSGSGAGQERGMRDSILHWWGDGSPIAPLPGVSVPTPRRSFGAAVIGQECFLVGGLTGDGDIAETVDVFDFGKRTWRQAAAPRTPRVFPSLVAVDETLYLFGGFTRSDGHFAPAPTLEAYNPGQDRWDVVSALPEGLSPSMTMLSLNGRLLFYGIDPEVDGRANFVLFDPQPTADPGVVESMSFTSRARGNESERDARLMMRQDTDKDGKLSREELGARMADFFRSADQDGDGFVSLQEAKAALVAQAEAEAAAEAEAEADKTSSSDDE
ncbi:DUF3386 family protein [Maioricimonas sp. JC845]|uniref:DUF3386 family protein n=1 Tax=Maioricimonas sp. JC845 TaxID=3232138 RepID=UPI003459D93A